MRYWKPIGLVGVMAVAGAADWPQWRGPNRDGVAGAFAEPASWPEKLTRKWRVEVGEGHSSPVVAGGLICLHTRQGEKEVLSCLRPESGQVVWQDSYAAGYQVNPAAARHGKGVKSTPVVAGGRIYTFGIAGALSAFNLQTGKLRWQKLFGSPDFGVATSPLVDRGLVIAYVGTTSGALVAMDPETGAEKWSWRGDGPAYASPIVVELEGVRQVVTQSRKNIIGVSEATGELLWKIPFTTPYDQNIVTPVVFERTLIFSGLNASTMGVHAFKRGAGWSTEILWQNKDVPMYMNSPVLKDNLLFGMSHKNKGQYFCLDARTGATLWTSDGRQGDNSAMVRAGNLLFLLNNEAELTVARASGKGFEILKKYTVADSPTWAHPVVMEKGVLIKDANTLALWNWM